MTYQRFPRSLGLVLPTGLILLVGCLGTQTRVEDARVPQAAHRPRRAASAPASEPVPWTAERLAQLRDTTPVPPILLMGQVAPPASQPRDEFSLFIDLPDISEAADSFRRRFERYSQKVQRDYDDVDSKTGQRRGIHVAALRHIGDVVRTQQARLSLAECVRRTLANNYTIRIRGYGPAISTAQIVQAEAAFDAAFFGAVNRQIRDTPVAVQLQAGQSTTDIYSGGLRQRLPTGATATLTQALSRTFVQSFQFQTINPAYFSNLTAELRQPLMRGFGIDFNRAQIDIARNTRDISLNTFRREVITILNNVERAYWTLVGARRQVVISAELLAQAERTLEQVEARKDYDAFRTLISNSKATVESRRADFIRIKNDVGNAEDQLRNLMNDSEFNLAGEVEIVPTDPPILTPVVRDRFREIGIALDRRPDIEEARLAVENARIQMGVAKNQAMPTLDFVLRHAFNGLGNNADAAFDEETTANFIDTFVSLEFAWNFGERGERAGIRAAGLQHSSAVYTFQQVVENVIGDCKVTLRALGTSLEQIGPSTAAVVAARDNLRSIQERQENKSPEQLNTVFNAQSQLANSRQALLQAVVTYNQSITEVERAKGTLLEYDNVILADQP